MVDEYMVFVKENGYFEHHRNQQSKYWMYETINEALRSNFYNNSNIKGMLTEYEKSVLDGNVTSFVAAKALLDSYFGR